MSWAFNSSYYLARVFNSSKGKPLNTLHLAYRKKTLPMRLKLFAKRLKCPFMYSPFLRKLVMKSGLKSIRVISEK
jgi:hypothetical protein